MRLLKSVIFFVIISLPLFGKGPDIPERPNTIVSDYTNTLSQSQKSDLERKLVAFDDSTSTQIAVVIMSTTEDYDIEEFSVQLFNKWKIGSEKNNNGVLLFIAKDDHNVFITTGYGIEGVLPDVICKRIIDQIIVPNFKAGNFYAGIDEGTSTIMSIVKGEYSEKRLKDLGEKEGPGWFLILVIIFIIIIVFFSKVNSVKRYARRNHLGFWAAWALLNAAANRSRGSWGGFSGGSGGGWGGQGGGGGFGGFGGGMSGGGGAGGSW